MKTLTVLLLAAWTGMTSFAERAERWFRQETAVVSLKAPTRVFSRRRKSLPEQKDWNERVVYKSTDAIHFEPSQKPVGPLPETEPRHAGVELADEEADARTLDLPSPSDFEHLVTSENDKLVSEGGKDKTGPSLPSFAALETVAGADQTPYYENAMKTIEKLIAEKERPSVSTGKPHSGGLKYGMRLPVEGYGYSYVHRSRGRVYGTDEMVVGLIRLAADFMRRHPRHPGLRLGDLSQKDGGEISNHASHENGRDVDIIFLATDPKGVPVDHDAFLNFARDGKRGDLRFDAARNWDLVALMLENPYWGKDIDMIFVGSNLKSLIMTHARGLLKASAASEREELDRLIRRADMLLRHYKNHDHHYHLRIKPSSEKELSLIS